MYLVQVQYININDYYSIIKGNESKKFELIMRMENSPETKEEKNRSNIEI